MKIIADEYIPFVKDYFAAHGELILKPGRAITAADVKEADMLLVRSVTPVNAALLEDSKVKFIRSVTAGSDHLDTTWLEANDIEWSVASGFNAPPVADYVVSAVAAFQKTKLLPQTFKAAVIGVGKVGQLVVRQLQHLKAEIILCDPLRAEQEPDFYSQPLETITDVDLISLHTPLTHTGPYPTHHFIDQAFLQRQKPDCILLNASRGAVIDSNVLLNHGRHLLWCFDVFEHEPHILPDILSAAAIATPHLAGYSVQSKMRGIEMIYEQACKKGKIASLARAAISLPRKELSFNPRSYTWQDVVLGVFNPVLMTDMLRTLFMHAENPGEKFDELRNGFNYRHEFAYTDIKGALLSEENRGVLKNLGFKFNQSGH